MIMKKYKIVFKLFLVSFLVSNLFAATNQDSKEDNNIAYLSLQKQASREYRVTGKFKKDNKYNEKNVVYARIDNNKKDDTEKVTSNENYNVAGNESGFDLLNTSSGIVYDISGDEVQIPRRLSFTEYQKAQVNYLEMERKYKTLALEKEISSKKKILDEELVNEFSDVFLIDALSKEIKALAVDKETVNINIDKKIRYVLPPEQYLKYKEKQNKKNKKNLK